MHMTAKRGRINPLCCYCLSWLCLTTTGLSFYRSFNSASSDVSAARQPEITPNTQKRASNVPQTPRHVRRRVLPVRHVCVWTGEVKGGSSRNSPPSVPPLLLCQLALLSVGLADQAFTYRRHKEAKNGDGSSTGSLRQYLLVVVIPRLLTVIIKTEVLTGRFSQ